MIMLIAYIDSTLRFEYVDDLSFLELVLFQCLVSDYDFTSHVANDIGIDEKFVDSKNLETQSKLNQIADWCVKNKMKLNEEKSKLYGI